MEKRILKAVAEATGVSEENIIGGVSRTASGARMMFSFLCIQKGLTLAAVAKVVDRHATTVGQGISRFVKRMSETDKYTDQLNHARSIISGEGGKTGVLIYKENDTHAYKDNRKHSIIDISSKHFGSGFMGMVDDEVLFSSDTMEEAEIKLYEIINRKQA